MAGKFPIKFVARAVIVNGKTVAYFPAKAYLFEEIKTYRSDGTSEQRFEVDYVTPIYDEKCGVENSPAYNKFYKKQIFDRYGECKLYIDKLHNDILREVVKNSSAMDVQDNIKRYNRYFRYATKLSHKYCDKEDENIINNL